LLHSLAALAAEKPAETRSAFPATARVECGAVRSAILGRAVRYCALLPLSYAAQPARRFPALYWLHGLGQNEQALVGSGGWPLVEELQRQKKISEYLIFTPDAGASFYLNSRDGRERYEDFFIREFIPAMDKRFRTRPEAAQRGISGVSMGGYGALRLGLKYPHLFGAVSAHSAALIEKPPANLSGGARLGILEEAFGSPPDAKFWKRSSPFTIARGLPPAKARRIYFDCGTEDEFGFETGNQSFSKLLDSRGVAHEFHLYPGGHGWSYTARHIAASLEFHSRWFAQELGS
jgi:S-formylglutathione hydrolase FrmB